MRENFVDRWLSNLGRQAWHPTYRAPSRSHGLANLDRPLLSGYTFVRAEHEALYSLREVPHLGHCIGTIDEADRLKLQDIARVAVASVIGPPQIGDVVTWHGRMEGFLVEYRGREAVLRLTMGQMFGGRTVDVQVPRNQIRRVRSGSAQPSPRGTPGRISGRP